MLYNVSLRHLFANVYWIIQVLKPVSMSVRYFQELEEFVANIIHASKVLLIHRICTLIIFGLMKLKVGPNKYTKTNTFITF